MGPNLGGVARGGFGHVTINGCVIDSAKNRVVDHRGELRPDEPAGGWLNAANLDFSAEPTQSLRREPWSPCKTGARARLHSARRGWLRSRSACRGAK